MRNFILSFLAVFTFVAMPMQARADYFVWQDPQTGLSLSFPDTWKVVSNNEANDLVTVMPPSGREHASCRIRASEDRRYMIYPPRYSAAIQRVDFSLDFWTDYLQEYTNPEIYSLQDGSGFGRGFASYATAGFESMVQGPYMARKALMLGSLYDDTAYVVECSSHAEAFDSWKSIFLSIAGSMDFMQVDHAPMAGYYRNFTKDAPIVFRDFEGRSIASY
jgi:hypothetical protein